MAGLSEGAAGRCEDSCLGLPCTGFVGTTGAAGVTGRGGVLPGPFGLDGIGAAAGGFDWTGLVSVVGWPVPEGPEFLAPVGARLGPCWVVPPETAPGFLTGTPEGTVTGFCGGGEEVSFPAGLDAGRSGRLLFGAAGCPGVPGAPGTAGAGVWVRGPFCTWEVVLLLFVWAFPEATGWAEVPAVGFAAGAGREGLPGLWGIPAFLPSFAVTTLGGTAVLALRGGAFSWPLAPVLCRAAAAGGCEVGWLGAPG